MPGHRGPAADLEGASPWFRAADNYISQKGFAHLPKIGDNIPAVFQPEGSITPSRVSPTFGQHASKLQEGDLVTGSIDIAHERVHMLPSIRDEGHAEQKKALVHTYPSLANHPA